MTTSILARDKQEYIAALAVKLADVPGAFAECGVYRGGILRMLAETHPERTVYGFDTFEGLPQEMWADGEPHSAGDFGDTSMESVLDEIDGCDNVSLVAGIFPESAAAINEETFALVHLDFDFYESTRAAIDWFLPRMSSGGAIVFDDYEWERCPGVKRAIDEARLTVERTVPYQAVYRVP